MLKFLVIIALLAVMIGLLFIIGAVAVRAEDKVVVFDNLKADQLESTGLEILKPGEIEISAVGAKAGYSERLASYGWIIDAASRELVWAMDEDCDDYSHLSDNLIECRQTLKLQPGRYEVYYYVGRPGINLVDDISINNLGDLIDLIGDAINFTTDDDGEFYEEDLEELSFVIRAGDITRSYPLKFDKPQGAIVSLDRMESDEYVTEGFSLTHDLTVSIYALGEYSDSYEIFADAAWIVNADDREVVWQMDKWNTRPAGGADKNRFFRGEVTLPAGRYVAYYATDDSHDFGRWNSFPPHDPIHYGLLIVPTNPAEAQYVSPFAEPPLGKPLLALTSVGNDASLKKGLTLKKEARLRILAYGERGYGDDELVDFGWIVDAASLRKVWRMTYDQCLLAGGTVKNCLFDGVITLPAGKYTVYYRTDGSHASGSWNAAPPLRHREYGIALYAAGAPLGEKDFELIDQSQPTGNVLADMTGLGDDEELTEEFTLDKTADIRIMALGEGKGGEMYDYGWIENEQTGETVWEMTYRMTDHAGGASKNRMVTAEVTLRPGRYSAHFVTDDSHSFDGFNVSPPDEPERWGMLITLK